MRDWMILIFTFERLKLTNQYTSKYKKCSNDKRNISHYFIKIKSGEDVARADEKIGKAISAHQLSKEGL